MIKFVPQSMISMELIFSRPRSKVITIIDGINQSTAIVTATRLTRLKKELEE